MLKGAYRGKLWRVSNALPLLAKALRKTERPCRQERPSSDERIIGRAACTGPIGEAWDEPSSDHGIDVELPWAREGLNSHQGRGSGLTAVPTASHLTSKPTAIKLVLGALFIVG